jgi:hypothetical protein
LVWTASTGAQVATAEQPGVGVSLAEGTGCSAALAHTACASARIAEKRMFLSIGFMSFEGLVIGRF